MIEAEKDSARDLISDLPDSIIETILTKLPIKDVVRTSILSTRWRYRWASITNLVFDDRGVAEYEEIVHFIQKFLLLHDGPIHKFSVQSSYMRGSAEVDQWFLFLSRREVKELIIELGEDEWFRAHSSLFSFKHLTRLELVHCELCPPPDFKGFMWLKHIDFQQVVFPQDDYDRLIAGCPLLETLTLSSYDSIELTIHAPNLKYLTVDGEFMELCLAHTPLLVAANINLYMSDHIVEHLEQSSSCNLDKFLGGAAKLERLVGKVYFVKFVSVGIGHGRRLMTYHHLKYIELYEVSFEDLKEVLVVLQLIVNSPVLKTLQVSVSTASRTKVEPEDLQFWDKNAFDDATLHELKTVKLSDVSGMPVEMGFIKFLLEHSPCLEEMTIRPTNMTDASVSMLVELASFRRASPQASVVFIHDPM
ncbi:F-box/FBD/LRR-repeat protein At1g13570-like isoform X1 [Salvia hispanica]|uniref:F-box/FBD/LRR-repeat protein At1g13570-like isoform X1 n=1 Tax=Salvia hispanica TaxID=49212 RepID=UPI002009C294|nr:F-box/FBD/LRR-repeat protein At1g13570-like isoform X1 [Salvia hispanica]XP_047962785.1 F-box/FBD/LRR-repeat protein At1g13570-like isoform X1 [Salvia hispanica]